MDGFLLGSLAKLYDDIADNEIPLSPIIVETLKVFIVVVSVLVLQKSFTLSLLLLVLLISSYLANEIDHPFWVASIPMTAVLTYISYSPIPHPIYTLLVLFLTGVTVVAEERLFPEEYSIKKILTRTGTALFTLLALLYLPIQSWLDPFGLPGDAQTALGSSMGYLLTSSVSQAYLMYRNETKQVNNQEE